MNKSTCQLTYTVHQGNSRFSGLIILRDELGCGLEVKLLALNVSGSKPARSSKLVCQYMCIRNWGWILLFHFTVTFYSKVLYGPFLHLYVYPGCLLSKHSCCHLHSNLVSGLKLVFNMWWVGIGARKQMLG